ncbi:glycosyltransferase [Arthrobacter sp. AL12]|uniref:glycosyltransferase n=1 Tax=Arthrobacter sp. AL12 TaxID=3042241 RepID=UPI00249A27D2|nr:glycosyltransferase [Arthrobacter sp. AL12]MDI3213092.1 glycosyltransferase [Arthrobacter sp. AL12]
MKILVVVPWAPSVTRPRSLGLIKHLAENNEVVVVGAGWSETEIEELLELPVSRVVPVRLRKISAYFRCILGLVLGRSLQQSYVDANKFRRVIRRELAAFQPDLGYLNVIRTAQFVNEFENVPTVIDLDEFRSAYYDLLSITSRNPVWRMIAKIEARRMRRAEVKVLEAFDGILVSSPNDLVDGHYNVSLVRSPHALSGVSPPTPEARIAGSIIFVGRQSYRANSEAVSWFVRQVFPRVVEHIPGAHLTIVGDAPSRSIMQMAGPQISVTGRVESLTGYYSTASVSIIPIRMATGVQMKLIESMALGAPVVATPIVVQGAGVTEAHCMVADTADEWVSSVVEVLLDSQKGLALAKEAARWASSTYSPEAIGASLDLALAELRMPDQQRNMAQ